MMSSRRPTTSSRFVAHTAFEHLHFAIVNFILTESKHKSSMETCHSLIENIGYVTGQKIAERTTANKPRFGDDHLDVIKVLCKEFWNDWFGTCWLVGWLVLVGVSGGDVCLV